MTIINGCPVSHYLWHSKEPSLLNGHNWRAKIKICGPSPAMVTSQNKWKILEWNEKLQTSKHFSHNYCRTWTHCANSRCCHPPWNALGKCYINKGWLQINNIHTMTFFRSVNLYISEFPLNPQGMSTEIRISGIIQWAFGPTERCLIAHTFQ